MKGLSLFFHKNTMGANMKKSLANSCNGQSSTSTLPNDDPPRKSVTLEEMILQLELEEDLARRENTNTNNNNGIHRRMSCVNNSDILRSARNALNQYPRFSLDGKDAMYRSSFRKIDAKERLTMQYRKVGRRNCSSTSVGGESVIWCKPGVVAKLMGLEAIPVPVSRINKGKTGYREERLRYQNPTRRGEYGGRGEACSSTCNFRTNGSVMRPFSSSHAFL